jgi:Mg-chelatase subunit ChlD
MIKNGVIEICPAVEVKPETEIFPIPTTTVVKVTGDPANHSGQSNPFGGGGGHESMEEHVIRQFLQRSGVPFDTVAGSALSYDGTNLIVTQSRQNLDTIRRILAASYEEENPSKAAEVPAFKLVDTLASENAFSTFSLNVSDVSFRLAAEALNQNRWPDKTSLRTEEFVNAVKYNDPPPAQNEAVALTQEQVRHPFAHNRDLLRLSVQTASAGRNFRQPLNLTVLLDTSGSMTRADRQEIVEVALQALADNLHPNDTVSVIGFSRHPRLLVDRVNGSMGAAQLRTLAGRIPPEGGTNLETALLAAYEKSRSVQTPGVQSTIVLLTDGAANLGDASPETLAHIISQNKKLGIGLNCYGIGFDGYNDAMLETLARTGNGRYAYLNNADEARNDFAAKLAGALQVAAQNVKVQVEFNPARVGAYRLMGYEKHRLKKEEFRDNSVAAAELGAAESGTAVYSIEVKPDGVGDVGVVRVRYQEPTTGDYKEREWNIPYSPAVPAFKDAAPGIQLAATAALLAEKLEGTEQSQAISLQTLGKYLKETDNALSVFPENRKLQSMVEAAIRLE